MTSSGIRKKLLKSQAVKSLQSEQNIHGIVNQLGWESVHSAFYIDVNTGKHRELDVVGKRSWHCKLKKQTTHAVLSLLIEAKSAVNYHLIFSPLKNSPKWENNHSYWVGRDERHTLNKRVDQLLNKGLSELQVKIIKEKLQSIAWPRETMLPGRLSVKPPPAPVYSSSFRETNIGNERELNNSVMWNASQSLKTAMSSLIDDHRYIDEDLNVEVDIALKDGLDPIGAVVDHFSLDLSFIWIYHPIIAIDSELWVTKNNNIEQINWCRFVQLNAFGQHDWWFDIVHNSYVDEYIKFITDYYKKTYRNKKATISL